MKEGIRWFEAEKKLHSIEKNLLNIRMMQAAQGCGGIAFAGGFQEDAAGAFVWDGLEKEDLSFVQEAGLDDP